jgi:TonB family protein
MVVPFPQPVQPWSGDPEEERRFRRILLTVLLVFSVIGYVVPNWTLPRIEVPWELELPPRIARVIAERIEPVSRETATGQVAVPAPDPAPAPETQAQPEIAQTPADTPRQSHEPQVGAVETGDAAEDQVERTGVLALSDRLAALRGSTSGATFTAPASGEVSGEAGQGARQTALLATGVTSGSEGIGSAPVGTRQVLGNAALPGKSARGIPSAGLTGGGQPSSRDRPGSGRSQEEIQEVLDRNKRSIYALYNRELRFDPTLRGKVVLTITIAPSGEVSDCRIVSSELNSPSLERKLVLLIKGIDFGAKPGVPSVTTKVPIEFFPA